jgi:hypothetical protein
MEVKEMEVLHIKVGVVEVLVLLEQLVQVEELVVLVKHLL